MQRLTVVGTAVLVRSIVALGLAVGGCTVRPAQPNLVGQDIRLTIIHTADIHSRLFPYSFVPNTFDRGYGLINGPFGGIARISTLVQQIRRSSNRSLWLDSGDCFQGAPVFNEFKGEAEMRALTLAGLDGAVLGNHEFDLGAKNLFDKIDNWAGYPLLAANYAWDDAPPQSVISNGRSLRDVVSPYQVYDVQGLRVGVIGMGNTSTITSIYQGGNSLGFRPIADNDALEQWVRVLRPQVDLVVVISHLGLDEDEGLTASQVDDPNAALPLQGVDLILGGHLHIVTNPPKIIENDAKGHQTVLVHSGAFAKFVGRLDLVVHVGTNNGDPDQRSRITSFSYINIPVDNSINDDPAIANLMWPYSVKLNQDIDLNGKFAYVDPQPAGTKILRNDASGGDSQLGNLVARAMQVQQGVDAEFSITNSLGIRADFERGPLTNEQMYNVFPFENSITVMYLSGQEVKDTLDFVARKSASRGCRAQAQVSGITFDMVCKGDCSDSIDPITGEKPTACAKNIVIGEHCRGDNPDGPVDTTKCAPLSITGLYRVAVNDYIAGGGSGFIVLKRNTSQQNTGISLRDALTVYLNKQPNVCGGMTTDQIKDETDTQTPQRTVKDRWGNISCLDENIEKHDGRIRPVFE
jgi:2',3'-cyclic-nucleotide 2'-phosphodiesterase (5'-nucleotidase family)